MVGMYTIPVEYGVLFGGVLPGVLASRHRVRRAIVNTVGPTVQIKSYIFPYFY